PGSRPPTSVHHRHLEYHGRPAHAAGLIANRCPECPVLAPTSWTGRQACPPSVPPAPKSRQMLHLLTASYFHLLGSGALFAGLVLAVYLARRRLEDRRAPEELAGAIPLELERPASFH